MDRPVRKRHVFYLSGYDPKGASFYYDLYAAEAPKQAALSGMEIAVGRAKRVGQEAVKWPVTAGEVATTYEFLRWEDIIRQEWARDNKGLMRDFGGMISVFTRTPILWRVFRTATPPFIAALYPLYFILRILLVAAFAAAGVVLAGRFVPGLPGLVTTLFAGLAAAGVLWFGRWLEKRMNSFWLMRIYAFIENWQRGRVAGIEEKLDAMAERVAAEIRDGDADEVLVVGHSVGTIMATSVMARAVRQLETPPQKTVSLLTLAQCTPILSYLPAATRFRADLETAGNTDWLDWVDVTAAADGGCFAFVDPLLCCGVARRDDADRPKLLSPRFHTLFAPASYKRIRKDQYRAHFQYLMAAEKPGDYDYFAITAGPLTLAERFRRKASVTNFTRFKVFK